MSRWTDAVDAQADVFFATLTEAEIRRRQSLCDQQIVMAHKQQNESALADLRRMEAALIRSMFARLKPQVDGIHRDRPKGDTT